MVFLSMVCQLHWNFHEEIHHGKTHQMIFEINHYFWRELEAQMQLRIFHQSRRDIKILDFGTSDLSTFGIQVLDNRKFRRMEN